MQPIQDKELDKLFREKFRSFEVEPSASLWDKIENDLDTEEPVLKKSRKFPLLWMVAASFTLVMSFALWFTIPSQQTQQLAQQTEKPDSEEMKNYDSGTIMQPEQDVEVSASLNSPSTSEKSNSLSGKPLYHQAKMVKEEQSMNATTVNMPEPPLVLNEAGSKIELSQSVKTAKANTLSITSRPDVVEDTPSPSSLLYTSDVQQEERSARSRNKIKSVGDLVNFVVAKVDHREEKIIEFKNDEDEGSTVSSMNLGLVKFRAKK